jgi:hypothetical protein
MAELDRIHGVEEAPQRHELEFPEPREQWVFDVGGQTAFVKKPFKYSKSVILSGRGKRLTGEQKTAGMIGDRQRVAVLTVP